MVVQAIIDWEGGFAIDGHLWERIKMLMGQFRQLTCSCAPRDCNKVAHKLARFAEKAD